ncbi:rRNA-processing protein efg1 [Exophiala xenobiotica]
MARYRPSSQTRDRRRDSYRPDSDTDRRHDSYRQDSDRNRVRGPDRFDRPRGLSPVRSAVTKSKKERHNNPSTRIHSLRNLLAKDTKLPMTVRHEKERELAALLLDQQKAELAKDSRKNLQRYHFVRFVERQKATRLLKKLIKLRDNPAYSGDEGYQKNLQKMIHQTEVDIAYTQYAPLGEKYISLFVEDDKEGGSSKTKKDKRANPILDEDRRGELRNFSDELANVARTATGAKPPMWYEVESYMAEGEDKLKALREGKLTGKKLDKDLAAVGGKKEADLRSLHQTKAEEKPSWLDDGGMIDPADLDSDNEEGGVRVREQDDEDMSDGGFFER